MSNKREGSNREAYHGVAEVTIAQEAPITKAQRPVSLYDTVAGRAGHNGFLTAEQIQSQSILPLAPEDVLLRRTNIPARYVLDSYDVAGALPSAVRLPESELLKAVHSYASDFYSLATSDRGAYDYRSLDETALIAMGILLEEAVRAALGENGDMVFVEPEGLEHGLEEDKMTRHQVSGRVKPMTRPKEASEDEGESIPDEDESPAKRRRH